MDIDLLSKMVKELILDKDEVYLPGIGSFVAEMVPSSFSDKGYTINPPYRRLYFRQRQDETDTALVDLYARSNNIDIDAAYRILTEFLNEMKEILQQKKTIIFPGLGRLRATRENNFFFVADEDLDIYPAGLGLEPVSLKTHQETEEEVAAALDDLKFIMEEDVESITGEVTGSESEEKAGGGKEHEESPEEDDRKEAEASKETLDEAPDEENPEIENGASLQESPDEGIVEAEAQDGNSSLEPKESIEHIGNKDTSEALDTQEESLNLKPEAEEPAYERKKKRGLMRTFIIILISVAIIALAIIIALAVIGHINPEFIDKFLYGKEELEILYQ